MAALAVPREDAVGVDVFFSSAMKGEPTLLINPDQGPIGDSTAQELGLALRRCQQQYEADHNTNAKCAEPFAIQAFLINNQDQTLSGRGKVSTYGQKGKREDKKGSIYDPCEASISASGTPIHC